MLVAMARKLSVWSGRLLEIYWVSSQLILRNPLWGAGRGAGWGLRTAGTLESRRGALITCRSDRGWGNKPAQRLFVRYFPLKIKLQFSVFLEKNRSGGAGKGVRKQQLSGCCVLLWFPVTQRRNSLWPWCTSCWPVVVCVL